MSKNGHQFIRCPPYPSYSGRKHNSTWAHPPPYIRSHNDIAQVALLREMADVTDRSLVNTDIRRLEVNVDNIRPFLCWSFLFRVD